MVFCVPGKNMERHARIAYFGLKWHAASTERNILLFFSFNYSVDARDREGIRKVF